MKKITSLLTFVLLLTLTVAVLPQSNVQAGSDGPNPNANPRAIENSGGTVAVADVVVAASTENNGVGPIKKAAGVEGSVGSVLQDNHEAGSGLAVGQMTAEELEAMFEAAADAEQVADVDAEVIVYSMTNGNPNGWWNKGADDLAALDSYPNDKWVTTPVWLLTEGHIDEGGIVGALYEAAYMRCNPSPLLNKCNYKKTGVVDFVPDVPLLPVVE